MIVRQGKQSWHQGRADAMRGAPSKFPPGLDDLAYSSGYIEGEAQRAKHPLRPCASSRPRRSRRGGAVEIIQSAPNKG